MRRTFSLCIPTLLLCLVIEILGSFLMWLTYMPIAGDASAAGPPTTISGTPAGVGGLNTLVNSSPTTVCSANCVITGGTRPGGGGNLFQSFGQFNIGAGDVATFQNGISFNSNGAALPAGLPTSNILARITGTNGNNPTLSSIYGTLQTSGFGNANLFLMNPAGFLFGPNATVNVGGMVSLTSADYLKFGDGKLFTALPGSSDTLLSTMPVAAYGFLGSNPGAITIQGSQLSVTPGQSLSLVGGNITFQSGTLDNGKVQSGQLSAPSGQINIASVASAGEVQTGTLNFAPNVNGQSFGTLGSVNISNQSVIDVSGNGGGTVLIRGGNFVLDNSTILAQVTGPGSTMNGAEAIGAGVDIQVSQNAAIQNGAVIDTSVTGNATPGVTYGGVHVKAGTVKDLDGAIFSNVSFGSTGGNSGNITLEGNSIVVQDSGTFLQALQASTDGAGNSGNIILTANGNIETDGPILITTTSSSRGNAGDIELASTQGNILMTNGAFVTSVALAGSGKAGSMQLSAPAGDIVLAGDPSNAFLNVQFFNLAQPGTGGSGGIQVTARNLTLSSANIAGDNFSTVVPGNITVTLSGTLSLNGTVNNFPTMIQTVARGPARSADLNITAHDISVTNGGLISTRTVGSGNGGALNIFADTLQLGSGGQITSGSVINIPQRPVLPTGAGGTVTITGLSGPAKSVVIDGVDSGIFTTAVGTGAAGNTNISAQSVTVQNGGIISAGTSGTAPSATGGSITINANQVQVNSGGVITAATTGTGAGGSVNINAGDTFSSDAGTISSTATQAGGGGNINIAGGSSVTLTNGASISASSTGQGTAGDIHINAGNQFSMTNSTVTTEANQSSGGTIKITTSPAGTVQLTDSKISASVLDGSGGGGSVNIDPQFVILEHSQIIANSVFGPGGNINITTNLLLPDTASIISASSQFGQQGNIVIQSPISPASGKIVPLSQKPLVATTLLSQRCAALAAGNVSSFTVAGRDSLPAEPGGWVSSPLALTAPAADAALQASGDSGSEDRNETQVISVRKIAPAGFLTQRFAGSTDCAS